MDTEFCFLRGRPIRVHSPGVSQQFVQQFTTLFDQAGASIPTTACVEIADYWQSRSTPSHCRGKCFPYQDYLPRISLRVGDGMPYCDFYGHQPVFFPATLAEMGRERAIVAIAHELAHVVLFSKGDSDHWAEPENEGRTKQEAYAAAERRVRELLVSWGIDETDCQVWVKEWEARPQPRN